jgi:S1-C subfamily serine protease
MQRFALRATLVMGLLVASRCISAAADLSPQSLVILRSQPAVFKVIAVADVEVTHPKSVTPQLDTLQSAYESAESRSQGQVSSGPSKNHFYWSQVGDDPDRFLKASQEKVTDPPDVKYVSTGSAFAVSRQGILLTNAHVVANTGRSELFSDMDNAKIMLEKPLTDTVYQLIAAFGGDCGDCGDDQQRRILKSLTRWLAKHSGARATVRDIKVVLNYATPYEEVATLPRAGAGIERMLRLRPRPITVNTRVLAIGEPYPGKDVAVLQMLADANFDPRDRIICLPLGDSGQVTPGDSIESMGFPAVAFNNQMMAPSAEFRVSAENGQISQTKEIAGGWEGFEMTAEMNHGDSGGPVVDLSGSRSGQVIGINVALENVGPGGTAPPGFNLAVPIDLAKPLLAQAGITPDVGPLTRQWINGLELFSRGRFARCRA